MIPDRIVLVNEYDEPVGTAGKYDVHCDGSLHRALSVFLFDSNQRLLLQRRHPKKYHSGGLWSNTCCTHPRPGEEPLAAAHRRLKEEMGIHCHLLPAFTIRYLLRLDSGLYEHEFDHVFVGRFDGTPTPDERKVVNSTWMTSDEVWDSVTSHPDQYTAWFRLMLGRVIAVVASSGVPSTSEPLARTPIGT